LGAAEIGNQAAKENLMTTKALSLPEIGLIASTRVALGVGIGLLLSDKLRGDQRKGAGWALLGMGVLTTVPLVLNVLRKPGVAKESMLLAS
jgi:hypothetical protein